MDEVHFLPAPPGLTALVRSPDADPLNPDDDRDRHLAFVLAMAWRPEDAADSDQDGPVQAGTSYLVSVPLVGGAPFWCHGTQLHNVAPGSP